MRQAADQFEELVGGHWSRIGVDGKRAVLPHRAEEKCLPPPAEIVGTNINPRFPQFGNGMLLAQILPAR